MQDNLKTPFSPLEALCVFRDPRHAAGRTRAWESKKASEHCQEKPGVDWKKLCKPRAREKKSPNGPALFVGKNSNGKFQLRQRKRGARWWLCNQPANYPRICGVSIGSVAEIIAI
jgi:hypothetical protein